MKLVPATPAMTPDLAAVHAQAFAAPWGMVQMAELLDSPGAAALLAVGEAADGMILWRSLAGEAEILTLAVVPSQRRRGLARALVEAAAGLARQAGAEAMFLEVAVDNAAAVALYQALGFEQVGVRRGYYDRGAAGQVDALVMRRALNAS